MQGKMIASLATTKQSEGTEGEPINVDQENDQPNADAVYFVYLYFVDADVQAALIDR